jgi:hypothetical protein
MWSQIFGILPSRRWEFNFLPLSMGWTQWNCFLGMQYTKKNIVNSYREMHGQHLHKMIKVGITSNKSCWYVLPGMMWWKGTAHHCRIFPKTYYLNLIIRQYQANPNWEYSKRSQIPNDKAIKDKERETFRLEEMWQLNAT